MPKRRRGCSSFGSVVKQGHHGATMWNSIVISMLIGRNTTGDVIARTSRHDVSPTSGTMGKRSSHIGLNAGTGLNANTSKELEGNSFD